MVHRVEILADVHLQEPAVSPGVGLGPPNRRQLPLALAAGVAVKDGGTFQHRLAEVHQRVMHHPLPEVGGADHSLLGIVDGEVEVACRRGFEPGVWRFSPNVGCGVGRPDGPTANSCCAHWAGVDKVVFMLWPVEEPMKPKPNNLRCEIISHIRSPHASPPKMWVMTWPEGRAPWIYPRTKACRVFHPENAYFTVFRSMEKSFALDSICPTPPVTIGSKTKDSI